MAKKEQSQKVPLARIKPVKKRIVVAGGEQPKKTPAILPESFIESGPVDAIVHTLLYLSQMLQVDVTPDQIFSVKKKIENQVVDSSILPGLLAEFFDIRSTDSKRSLKKVIASSQPAILHCHDGSWLILVPRQAKDPQIYDPVLKQHIVLEDHDFGKRYSGKAILFEKKKATNAQLETGPEGKFNALWLIKIILQFKSVFIQVLVAAFLIQIFALVTPLFTMVIIDKVFSSGGSGTLHVLIIGLFAISIFDYLISGSRQLLLSSVTHKMDYILASNFFRKLTALPLSFFSTKQIGDAVSRAKELDVIRNFFTGSAFMLLIDFPFLLVFIGIMLMFSVTLTATASVFIIAVLLLYGVFGPFIRERLKHKNHVQSDNNSFLIETIGGIEAIKSMSLESKVLQRWKHLLIQNARSSARTEAMTGQISQAAGFLTKSTTAVCLWIGALLVLDGKLTPGQLIAFNMMVGRVIAPTQRISQLLQQLNQMKISLQRVGEIMNASPELHVRKMSQLPRLNGSIRLENVGFKYREDGKEVLKNISFDIQAGENIALIGSTGSGKTTLLRLLQRLHLPTTGSIYIDDINVMGINPGWFREKIGVVSQENLLFNLSIMQNIQMAGTGTKPIDVEEVVAVCKAVGADRWIRRLPDAYDTVVGERGGFLSGGQRQQISIARALLRNPRILLLDEATSALDNESERVVEQNMERLFKGRTVIIVAHRLPRVHVVNRIVTLKDGELVDVVSPNAKQA